MPSPNITTSGNIISDDFVELLREPAFRHEALLPETFGVPGKDAPKSPEEGLAVAYELLRDRWEALRADISALDLSTLRARWMIPLLRALDFDPQYLPANLVLGEGRDAIRFDLSHRGGKQSGAPVLHSVEWNQDLDTKPPSPRGARSPHDTLQQFLNLSPADQWAILTNGRSLRILRDFHHSLTKGYVEIDLEGLFESGDVGDFRALYRLAHASRFVPNADGECPLERFHRSSHETGVEVGKKLRNQVKEAIETLGNGFLTGDLMARLQQDADVCQAYYSEILHLVYRLLFLLFVEQKGWVPMRSPVYVESYSVSGMRDRAVDPNAARDEHCDLWEGLKITFRLVREGFEFPDGRVPAYGGQLFDDRRFTILNGTPLQNCDLLAALRCLCYFERDKVLHRINYSRLQIDALGSVYESLLEYTPRVLAAPETVAGKPRAAGSFVLDPRGLARKASGSYYTDRRLVNELIDSALRPVITDRLAKAKTDEEKERALLSITVCDPACGSAAFLVAAMECLGEELAKVRAGGEQPTEQQLRQAKRDVLQHCIFGVDLNPMAVELAKVSLWIAAAMPDMPLNFLDNHIKCGNSLIGAPLRSRPPDIPDEAFEPVTGDDRKVAAYAKKRNRGERKGKVPLPFGEPEKVAVADLAAYGAILSQPERLPEEVEAKQQRYEAYRTSESFRRQKLESDVWTAAFFWPLAEVEGWLPTTANYLRPLREPSAIPAAARGRIDSLAQRLRFFHWHLEFPTVFARGGFDVVVSNPPWDMVQVDPGEFFAFRAPEIASGANMAAKERMIRRLAEEDPGLHAEYQQAKAANDKLKNFVHASGRFPLTEFGRINLAPLFAELALDITAPHGRAGLVVPTGIATDAFNQHFFASLVQTGRLVSLFDFENREALFPGVHRSYKFCLLTLRGAGEKDDHAAQFAFFLTRTDHLRDRRRLFGLTSDDFALLNPNTRTCPVFRTRVDAELTRYIYERVPVLVNEEAGENPWGVQFKLMFMMNTDSHLFRTREQLENKGFCLSGNRFTKGDPRSPDEVWLPLYEGKMIWQFDHRFGTYELVTSRSSTHLPTPEAKQYGDPSFLVLPCYWVPEEEVERRLNEWNRGWLLGFRRITNASNERTTVACLFGREGAADGLPICPLGAGAEAVRAGCLLADLNSFPLDFVARQKIGGMHMDFHYAQQIPGLPPSAYRTGELAFVVPRVAELVCTAWDTKGFGDELWREADEPLREAIRRQWEANKAATGGHKWNPPEWAEIAEDGIPLPPFKWDEGRRARIRAELDAYFARLYGLIRKQLRYILDPHDLTDHELETILDSEEDPPEAPRTKDFPGETFRVLKEKEIRLYGEYRTRRLVLEAWDRMFGGG